MNKMDGLRGMLLPLPTVFDGEGQLDEAVMRDMIQFYVHTGVHGLFPLGSYGMGPTLSIEQRKRVAKIVVEEVRGRIPSCSTWAPWILTQPSSWDSTAVR